MKATIKMVAEHAGVSRGTVDRVLHKRGNVKPEVSERVWESIKELSYTPNEVARALAFSGNTRKIGFLLPDQPGFFYQEVMRAIHQIESESQDLGIEICVRKCNVEMPELFVKVMDDMLLEGICAFAVCAPNSQQVVEKINAIVALGIPVITVNSDIPQSNRNCFIGEDAKKSGQVAAGILSKHLRNQEQILIIAGNPEFSAHKDRVYGFCNYLKEQGFPANCCQVVYTRGSNQQTRDQVSKMLREYPRISSAYLAIDTVEGFADVARMMALPIHLFTVCHDTDTLTLEMLQEGIVDFTIDQDLFAQGYRPLQLLIDYLLNQKPIEHLNEKIGYRIISAECIE